MILSKLQGSYFFSSQIHTSVKISLKKKHTFEREYIHSFCLESQVKRWNYICTLPQSLPGITATPHNLVSLVTNLLKAALMPTLPRYSQSRFFPPRRQFFLILLIKKDKLSPELTLDPRTVFLHAGYLRIANFGIVYPLFYHFCDSFRLAIGPLTFFLHAGYRRIAYFGIDYPLFYPFSRIHLN